MASSQHVGRPVHLQTCAMEPLEARALLSRTAAATAGGRLRPAACDGRNRSSTRAGLVHTVGVIPTSTQYIDLYPPARPLGGAATVVGRFALFAEGFLAGHPDEAVDVYDLKSGAWTSNPWAGDNLASAVTVGDLALFAGGGFQGVGDDSVHIFNVKRQRWSEAHLSVGRYFMSAVSVDGKAIFAGGLVAHPPQSAGRVVDIFDANTGRWLTAELSAGRVNPAAAVAGDTALFADGGSGDNDNGNDASPGTVDLYNAGTNTWSTAQLSQTRYFPTAASVGRYAIFAGGAYADRRGVSHPSDVVDLYDGVTGRWSTAHLSHGRAPVAAVVGHQVIFAGNRADPLSADLGPSDAVDIFNADTGQWSTAKLSQARAGMVTATIGGKVLFAGGVTDEYGGTGSAVVDVFDAATGKWSVGPPLSVPRQVRSAVTIGNTAMFAWTDPGGSNVIDYYTVR